MKRFLVEFAMGTVLHGQNVTKAACKAVRNAISNCCLCGITDCLGIKDLDNHINKERINATETYSGDLFCKDCKICCIKPEQIIILCR